MSVITGSLLQENLKLKEQLNKLQEGLAIAANPVRQPTHVKLFAIGVRQSWARHCTPNGL